MAANITKINSTRIQVQLFNLDDSELESNKIMFGDIDEQGRVIFHGGKNKTVHTRITKTVAEV
jgi:hypothetical protein